MKDLEKVNVPNLIIPGFPKSGTSSLFDYLCQHPDIFKPKYKEPHNYSQDKRYSERFSTHSTFSFNELYNAKGNCKYIPDASTSYLISKHALKRIKRDSPNAKLIIIARDPIERLFSHYNWLRLLGFDQFSFKKEIKKDLIIDYNPNKPINGNYKSYIEHSKYGEQTKRCLEVFDKNQVLILSLENLNKNFNESMDRIFRFLEIEPISINRAIKNKTPNNIIHKKLKIPTKLKIIEKKIGSKVFSNSKIFNKKLQKINFTPKYEKFIFDLLKNDLEILKENNLVFPEWKTVNKYL